MSRYVTLPATAHIHHTDDGVTFMPYLTVDGPTVVDTGLVDQHGNEICRVSDPIGFQF